MGLSEADQFIAVMHPDDVNPCIQWVMDHWHVNPVYDLYVHDPQQLYRMWKDQKYLELPEGM